MFNSKKYRKKEYEYNIKPRTDKFVKRKKQIRERKKITSKEARISEKKILEDFYNGSISDTQRRELLMEINDRIERKNEGSRNNVEKRGILEDALLNTVDKKIENEEDDEGFFKTFKKEAKKSFAKSIVSSIKNFKFSRVFIFVIISIIILYFISKTSVNGGFNSIFLVIFVVILFFALDKGSKHEDLFSE